MDQFSRCQPSGRVHTNVEHASWLPTASGRANQFSYECLLYLVFRVSLRRLRKPHYDDCSPRLQAFRTANLPGIAIDEQFYSGSNCRRRKTGFSVCSPGSSECVGHRERRPNAGMVIHGYFVERSTSDLYRRSLNLLRRASASRFWTILRSTPRRGLASSSWASLP